MGGLVAQCVDSFWLWIPALWETLQLYVGQHGTACHCHPHQGSLCAETTCISPSLPHFHTVPISPILCHCRFLRFYD